jgi:hypothetical protein
MSTATEVNHYRTSDMALATFMKMRGHTAQRVAWEANTCYWYFAESMGLLELVDEFLDDRASVNPKEFNRVYGTTKSEFFEARKQSSKND